MARPRVQVSIDTNLWETVHRIFACAVTNLPGNVFLVDEKNGYTNDALAVFPLAVTTFEAYFNTNLLSIVPSFNLSPSGSDLLREHREALSGLDLHTRVLLLTRIACGKTFDQGRQPFMDFCNLIKIRNALVHFQMQEAPLKVVDDLTQRRIAWPERIGKSTWAWVDRISTVECMRWAINTVSSTTAELQQLIGSRMLVPLSRIPESRLHELLAIRKKKCEESTAEQPEEPSDGAGSVDFSS